MWLVCNVYGGELITSMCAIIITIFTRSSLEKYRIYNIYTMVLKSKDYSEFTIANSYIDGHEMVVFYLE